ncbi:MAG: hypothetical protein V1929_12730 [bacterium]
MESRTVVKETGGWDGYLDWVFDHFPAISLFLLLAVYGCTYASGNFGRPIRSDGVGYYMYLPSLVIYGDPGFEKVEARSFDGAIPSWTGIDRYEKTGRYLNRFNIGVAVMMLPFFLVAHLLALMFQGWALFGTPLPADGFSFWYQHGAGLSGLFYLWAGLLVMRRQLQAFFPRPACALALAAMLLGTNLFNYGSGETVISHPYSFFLFAVLLLLVPAWIADPKSKRIALLLGLTAGLILLVRLNNSMVLMFIPLYGVTSLRELTARVAFLLRHVSSLVIMVLASVAVFVPQILIWRYATGAFVIYSYGKYGFDFRHPHVLEILFSFERGLFFWFPILSLAVAGFATLRVRVRAMVIPSLLYFLVHIYLVASWCQWGFGGGFGHRAFVETYPLLLFPLASFYADRPSPRSRKIWAIVSMVFVAWTLLLMVLYYRRQISIYGLDGAAVYDIIWWLKQWVTGG